MKRFALICGLLLVLCAAPATAGPITVFSGVDIAANDTDPRPNSNAAAASFDAAAGALGTNNLITFESAPLGAFTNLTVAPGVTINGADVSGNPQTIRNSPFGTPDSLFGYNTTAGGSQFVSLFGGSLTFSFATAINSFGAYLSGVQLVGETINFNDGSSQSIAIPDPQGFSGGVQFLGFTDAGASISSIVINVQVGNEGDIVGVDDVRYVTPGTPATPEPSSLVLMGLGGLGLVGSRLRRRQGAV